MTIDKPVVMRARCPRCGKVMAEWVSGEAGFTCRKCHIQFTFSSSAQVGILTNHPNCDTFTLTTR